MTDSKNAGFASRFGERKVVARNRVSGRIAQLFFLFAGIFPTLTGLASAQTCAPTISAANVYDTVNNFTISPTAFTFDAPGGVKW